VVFLAERSNDAQAPLICRMLQGFLHITGPPFIAVSSVDGFQGGEKEAVVFLAERSNDAQARLIHRMLQGFLQITDPPFIAVSSVDGFQGREKEAVVFLVERSNDHGTIGFTSDWRRVNVYFTRAI